MTRETTVILALGAALSLLLAPFLVGSLFGGAQEEKPMMKGAQGANAEECHGASMGKKSECKNGDGKSSCGGAGLSDRCDQISEKRN